MLIALGAACTYVPEYMNRAPVACQIVESVGVASHNRQIFKIKVIGKEDALLGGVFYVEVSNVEGLRDPENIVPVRTYTKFGAWNNEPLRFTVDVVENGFMCSKEGVIRYFPTKQQ